jgi:hypothetical protein
MPQNPSNRLYRAVRNLLRLSLMAAIMMGIGWVLEHSLSERTFSYLTKAQREAFAAVESINPFQIKDRFVCALRPSVESLNRMYSGERYRGMKTGMAPISSDCMYTLSTLQPAILARSSPDSSAAVRAPLPTPVIRHWAENMSAPSNVVVAFLDTAWHLVVQPSVFASLFAIVVFVLAGFAAAILMLVPKFRWHPFVGPVVYCFGTVAIACVAGWGVQVLMEGGLYLFGRVTQIAGLCCGGAGLTLVGYNLIVKTVEVRIHEGIDHAIPH